ncbi:MAG: hypothetical protein ACKO7B_11080 [Flavobacteriales bacterium]
MVYLHRCFQRRCCERQWRRKCGSLVRNTCARLRSYSIYLYVSSRRCLW